MPRAETTLVRVTVEAHAQLDAAGQRLGGVSKSSLVAGVAAWLNAHRGDKLPADLLKAIDAAAQDAAKRHANGMYQGSIARGAQITANGGPRNQTRKYCVLCERGKTHAHCTNAAIDQP